MDQAIISQMNKTGEPMTASQLEAVIDFSREDVNNKLRHNPSLFTKHSKIRNNKSGRLAWAYRLKDEPVLEKISYSAILGLFYLVTKNRELA